MPLNCTYLMQYKTKQSVICKFESKVAVSGLIDAYFLYFNGKSSPKREVYYNFSQLTTASSDTEFQWKISEMQLIYNFTFLAFNEFGVATRNETIYLKNISVPFPVHFLEYENNTIRWSNANKTSNAPNFNESLFFEITLKSAYHEGFLLNFTSNSSHCQASHFGMSLARVNLIPFTYVDVEIRAKIFGNGENMWSELRKFKILTDGHFPPRPPNTHSAGFFIDEDRNKVFLYWEQLKVEEYYGEDFEYYVEVMDPETDQAKE